MSNHLEGTKRSFYEYVSLGYTHPMAGAAILPSIMLVGLIGFLYAIDIIPELLLYFIVPIVFFGFRLSFFYRLGKKQSEEVDQLNRDALKRWADAGGDARGARSELLSSHKTIEAATLAAGLGAGMAALAVNIDGTPMLGDIDIKGNPYGVTDSLFDNSMSHMDDLHDMHSHSGMGSSFDE